MTRRDFLDRLARLVGGPAAAMAVLPLLQNDYRSQLPAAEVPKITAPLCLH